ncbi:unnamed protein product [Auanema sp. JU1783]|nr:unnamed protein product [Auanema sp. JU1783]
MMEDPMMPDLSHLSAEEREIIEQVLRRQKEEESKDVQMTIKADEELDQIERQINERKESARRLVGTQDDAICQICQKTKFADGIGHKCFYCQLRSCARCGGRAQSKNKAIWACSLCQKRQQILARTGKWFQPEEERCPKMSNAGMPSPSQPVAPSIGPSTSGSNPQIIVPPSNSNPNLNGPQINQQHSAGVNQRLTSSQTSQPSRQQGNGQLPMATTSSNTQRGSMSQQQAKSGSEMRKQNTLQRQPTLENDLRQPNGSVVHQRHSNMQRSNEAPSSSTTSRTLNDRPHEDHRNRRNIENTSPFASNPDGPFNDRRDGSSAKNAINNLSSNVKRRASPIRNQRISDRRTSQPTNKSPNERQSPVRNGPFDGRPNEEYYNNSRQTEFRRSRSIREDEGRRGSIGVRLNPTLPAAEVAPVPVANPPTSVFSSATATANQRQKKSRLHRQIRSMSSSDEEVATTSEGFVGEDARQRVPNECTSEKDLLRYIYGSEKSNSLKGRKTGAVSGYSSDCTANRRDTTTNPPSVLPGNVLAAKIRTYLSHPVTWQPSADQRRLIGHMVLHRTDSSVNGDLGLKVVGGRRLDTGRLGAFVTRVKPGSVADTVGRLRPGDEMLEWNGQPLQNATYDQVYEIISASKHESQVELIVSRSACVPGGDDFLNVQNTPNRQLPNPKYIQSIDPDCYASPSASPMNVPPATIPHSQSVMLPFHHQSSPRHRSTAPGFYSEAAMLDQPQCYGKGQIFGRIELSIIFSPHDRQLNVTVERAFDLPPRPDGALRNPYVKLFLLPDRSEKSRRQSAVLAETTAPYWSEAFYYQNISEAQLMERALEVTVWDYDKYTTNSFLGETLVDFSTIPLDGQPLLYTLVDMDDENPLRLRLRQRKLSQYSGVPQRPRSEMAYAVYDPYIDQQDYPPRHVGPDQTMRRSRTYDRAGLAQARHTPVRMEEDWNINQTSGYLSDYAYSNPPLPVRYHRQRRPRSATAMRHMTPAEMSASRMYSRRHPMEDRQWEDAATPEQRYPPQTNHLRYPSGDPRSPNGRLMEVMQEQQGYGSDGSETLSIHSAHSMPVVRTINRRGMPQPTNNDIQETSMEEYIPDEQMMQSVQKNNQQNMNMKERKKSLMTRFIPGRGAGGAEMKRTGFARSEEVGVPGNLSADRLQAPFLKQASKESNDSGDNWLPVLPDGPLGTFVDNLGPGQVVGRQVLASPVLGEIQIAIMGSRNGIEVEIIKANNLVVKPGTKTSPAPYVKVYLMEGKQCIAKAKTNPVKRTTSPLIQQRLQFNENPRRKMLQITVLGDYGRMERKAFMGIAQIRLDDLELGPQPIIGWYKLYHSSSLAGTGPIRKDSETSLAGVPQ